MIWGAQACKFLLCYRLSFFFLSFFSFLFVETGLLGNLARQDFSLSDQEHDMDRRILTTHGPDLNNQGSGEYLVLSRPTVQLPSANIQPQ